MEFCLHLDIIYPSRVWSSLPECMRSIDRSPGIVPRIISFYRQQLSYFLMV